MAAFTPEKARMQLRSQHGPQNYDTVCGIHRALWAYIDLLPEPQRSEAEELLVTAYLMGSKMNEKLVDYKRRSET